jgi:SAM-dependent methyltransferase
MKTLTVSEKTIADFGDQWTTYADNEGFYGSLEFFSDVIFPFLSLEDFQGATVADIGAGTGRFVPLLLAAGAKKIYAVEPSAAFAVLRGNTAAYADRITLLNIKVEDLTSNLQVDVVFSYGVFHHIPEPLPALRAVYHALRPGGRCLIWLYGYEGNELYLTVVRPLRTITTRLPDWALRAVSSLLNLAADVYIFCCRILPLPLEGYVQKVFSKLDRRKRFLAIFDQLNPAYAKYYREDEVRALFEEAGFIDVRLHHRHGYSWTAIGRRP